MSIAGHRPTILLYKHSLSPARGCILSSEHVERRLAAILAADVAGSCRLMGIDEEGTLARLKALRKTLFDPKISDRRGRIVKNTGDGALVEFSSLVDAVRCAVEIQRGMAEQNIDVPQVKRIEFRISPACRNPSSNRERSSAHPSGPRTSPSTADAQGIWPHFQGFPDRHECGHDLGGRYRRAKRRRLQPRA